MSSGTCHQMIDDGSGGRCGRPKDHPGDHLPDVFSRTRPGTADPRQELCGAKQSKHSLDSCKSEKGHAGRHSDPAQGVSWPPEKVPEAETFTLPPEDPAAIPHAVRTRVGLHRAQTEYDLTVLRNRLDCMPAVTNPGRELRRRREQLTAELEAWTYLAKITHTRMD